MHFYSNGVDGVSSDGAIIDETEVNGNEYDIVVVVVAIFVRWWCARMSLATFDSSFHFSSSSYALRICVFVLSAAADIMSDVSIVSQFGKWTSIYF